MTLGPHLAHERFNIKNLPPRGVRGRRLERVEPRLDRAAPVGAERQEPGLAVHRARARVVLLLEQRVALVLPGAPLDDASLLHLRRVPVRDRERLPAPRREGVGRPGNAAHDGVKDLVHRLAAAPALMLWTRDSHPAVNAQVWFAAGKLARIAAQLDTPTLGVA